MTFLPPLLLQGCTVHGNREDYLDTRSTNGCFRGNAAWLIREAKARNPDIAIYGLPWGGMPAWVGGGDYWSEDSRGYFSQFIDIINIDLSTTTISLY